MNLSQAEMNFYGYNPNNIICRKSRGKISVVLRYDAKNKLYVVTRRTPKTIWQDRYTGLLEAKERYKVFLYYTNKQLEEAVKKRGRI